MQNLAATLASAETSPLSVRYFSARLVLSFLFFGALWFILCRQLSGEWSVNEQYNYGWFVPFFALYLFWLRWQDRPAPEVRSEKVEVRSRLVAAKIGLAALFLLLPVRLFEIANPEWRPLAWVHATAVVTLTLLLIWCAGGGAWLRHFAFPVAFIFVAVPWPTPLETPVIQGLMRLVAHVAAETAMLLGTPAHVEGNLIRVSNGLVGVNEACSGIRSLQTSLMIGLLFGELKRLSISRRGALVAGAIAIALLANFLRAVFLVRVAATENISEVGHWHDIAGYTIIALVFVGTMVLAYLLGRPRRNSGFQPEPSGTASSLPRTQTGCPLDEAGRMPALLVAALCWIAAVEFGAHFWYRLHESNLVDTIHWNVQWPASSPNFRELKVDEEVRRQLRFDQGFAASWTLPAAASPGTLSASKPNPVTCLLYLFRWQPGRNSALLANLHRPDVCLPASGWTKTADDGVRRYSASGSFELPFRHFEFQRAFEDGAPQTAHAFYCLSEDRPSNASASLAREDRHDGTNLPGMFGNRSEWTRAERLRAVLEGRRHLGQQVMEVVFISREPLSSASAESCLRDLVRDVVVSGEGRGD